MARFTSLLLASCGAPFTTVLAASPAIAQQVTYNFDIPAQPLPGAIIQFSRQSQTVITAPSELVSGKISGAVKGRLTSAEALTLLLRGTGLRFEIGEAGSIAIVRSAEGNAGAAEAAASTGEVHAAAGAAENESSNQTIVVTGTHIRGGSAASPAKVVSRQEIDLSGAGTVQDFVQFLPENFRGGASEGTVGQISGGGRANNALQGTGLNLRGLGNDATLVLVDGHRVAPGGLTATFVDISSIPLVALERIEIVPDGTSAIYGSDAVAGVANFILRRDYSGEDTRLRYAQGTDGHPREVQFGQSFGRTWDSGAALVAYEYFDRTALDASQRSFTAGATGPFTLLPDEKRHSVAVSAHQSIGTKAEIFFDGLYGHRTIRNAQTTAIPNLFSLLVDSKGKVDGYNATGGARFELSNQIKAEVSSTYSRNTSDDVTLVGFNGAELFPVTKPHVVTDLFSIDPQITGSVGILPAGPLNFAVGGQYRRERSTTSNAVDATGNFSHRRDITADYGEAVLPLLSGSDPGVPLAEITVADRYEHYSDFGSTNDPKAGVVLRPIPGLKFRGTVGTSFKAPFLSDLNPIPFEVSAQRAFDPTTGAEENYLVVFGGNPNLRPEKARSFSLGVDWQPPTIPKLRASATYYNIHFKNRIADAQSSGIDISNAFAFEGEVGPTVIMRNPTLAEVTGLVSNTALYTDFTGIPGGVNLSTIGAILDSRAMNTSRTSTDGVDFSLQYALPLLAGDLTWGVDGTYIIHFKNQFESAPVADVLNTPFNPVDLKARAQAIYRQGGLTFAAFLNYVDSYTDRRAITPVRVGSFTTLDVGLAYEIRARGPLRGLSLSGGALNVTNESSPDLAPNNIATPFIRFDGANANVLGRYVYVQLAKKW
jgi:outer membrane receptor protein involved in Fe transport